VGPFPLTTQKLQGFAGSRLSYFWVAFSYALALLLYLMFALRWINFHVTYNNIIPKILVLYYLLIAFALLKSKII